ncbi:hypothetical protein LRZ95_00255, partial [Candidatus Gracilibacteria bacterium]|nr:hypothetical protein [Candidatus Gracilibacteria bacterium]
MKLKQKIINELNKNTFPNLKFLFSEEVLDISLELLNEFLEEDKKKFKELLKIENKDLVFESFENESKLDYFWSLLNHYQNIENTIKIRKIIEEFRPKLQDFGNEVSYSKELFKKYKYINENLDLDSDQKRIMFLRLKAFRDRGINLSKEKQDKLKNLNKKL